MLTSESDSSHSHHTMSFNSTIPAIVNSKETNVNIELLTSSSSIEIKLINLENLFEIYISKISAGIFAVLKNSQNLKVDFKTFKKFLVEMLAKIETKDLTAEIRNSKKVENEYDLIIYERNDLRNLKLVELNFKKPSDKDFKKMLAQKMKELEKKLTTVYKRNLELKSTNRSLEDELNEIAANTQKETDFFRNNLEKLRNKFNFTVEELKKEKEISKKLKLENLEFEKNLNSAKIKSEEIDLKLQNQIETAKLNEELESKLKIMEEDIKTANSIISKQKVEISQNLENKNILEAKYKKLKKERKNEKKESLKNLQKISDSEKLKNNSENRILKLEEEVKELKLEKTNLKTKLENAQNVYNHFYKNDSKNFEGDSFNESIHPEPLPK